MGGKMAGAIGPTRTHGIRATYVDGCRCRKCQRAEAVYNMLRRRDRSKSAKPRQRTKPQWIPSTWTERAKCKGNDLFFERCCVGSKKEREAFTGYLRAICNACPVLTECRDDVMYWESFHPDQDRALFQAGMWPEERTEEAKVRRIIRRVRSA